MYIYIYIPGDPESKLAGEKRFNERRKPSPPLFGNKDDEGRRIEKVRIKGTFFLRRKRRIFSFSFYSYSKELKLMEEVIVTFTNFRTCSECVERMRDSENRIYSATVKIQC